MGKLSPKAISQAIMDKTSGPNRPKGAARLPLGYVWREDGNDGCEAALDPERAPIIQKAFRKVALGDWTVQWAFLWLTYETDFRVRGGHSLSAQGFLRLLMDPAYFDGRLPPMVSESSFQKARLVVRNVRAWNRKS